jgi:hypothetical protein
VRSALDAFRTHFVARRACGGHRRAARSMFHRAPAPNERIRQSLLSQRSALMRKQGTPCHPKSCQPLCTIQHVGGDAFSGHRETSPRLRGRPATNTKEKQAMDSKGDQSRTDRDS